MFLMLPTANSYCRVGNFYSTLMCRDVGSISNLGGHNTLRALFFKKKGAFLRIERTLLCLLQNLLGTCPQCPPPRSYVYSNVDMNKLGLSVQVSSAAMNYNSICHIDHLIIQNMNLSFDRLRSSSYHA